VQIGNRASEATGACAFTEAELSRVANSVEQKETRSETFIRLPDRCLVLLTREE